MNINKKELKIISYDFHCIGNRVIRVSYNEFLSVLKIFLKYIDETEIIKDYISICKRNEYDVEKEVNSVNLSWGRELFDLGITQEEEVFTVYSVLKYIDDKNIDIGQLGRGYASSNKYRDIVKEFNNRVTLVLIQYIAAYLTKIGIEMGYDEEEKYMITINGGNGVQVNISKDDSTINAVQNNGINTEELNNLIKSIKESLNNDIPEEEKEMIEENIETIKQELSNNSPKKGLIKSCILGLKNVVESIPTAIVLCKNIETLIEYVVTKINL